MCWRDLLKTTQNESLNSGIVCRYAFRFHHFQTWHLFLRLPANRAIGEGCKRSPIRNRLVGVNKTIWRHSAISRYEYDRLMFAYDLRHHQIPAHKRERGRVARLHALSLSERRSTENSELADESGPRRARRLDYQNDQKNRRDDNPKNPNVLSDKHCNQVRIGQGAGVRDHGASFTDSLRFEVSSHQQ